MWSNGEEALMSLVPCITTSPVFLSISSKTLKKIKPSRGAFWLTGAPASGMPFKIYKI